MPKILDEIQLWKADRSAKIALPDGSGIEQSLTRDAQITRRLGNADELTLTVKAGCKLATATASDGYELSQGKIIRMVYDDSSIEEWRIKQGTREFSGQQDVKVVGEPIYQDLKKRTIRKTLANGHTRASVSFYNQTFEDVVTNLLSSEYNCPALFTLGSVETGLNDTNYNLVLNAAYVMEGIRELCQLAEAEWDVTYNATNDNYEVNFYEEDQMGGGESEAPDRPIAMGGGKGNRRTLQKQEEVEGYFSRIVPLMGEGSELQTIGAADWDIDSSTYDSTPDETTIILEDRAIAKDGYGLIQGKTIYFGNASEGWHEVLSTSSPNQLTVSGDASGLTHGLFKEGAAKNDVIFLEDAAAVDKVGIKEEKFSRPDIPPYANLIDNPGLSEWTNGMPDGLEAIDGSETVSQEGAELFSKHGTLAAKVECNTDQGLQTAQIDLNPTDDNPHFSSTVYVHVENGSVRIEMEDSEGTIYPTDEKAETSRAETIAIRIGGAEPASGNARIKVIAQEDNTVFYLDALTLTQSGSAIEYAPQMGPKALWMEAARYMKRYGGDRPDVWEGEVMDDSFFGTGSKEIEIGSFVKVQEDWNEDTQSYDTEFTVRVVELTYSEDRVNGRYKKNVRLADRYSPSARMFQEQYLTADSRQQVMSIPEPENKNLYDRDEQTRLDSALNDLDSNLGDLDQQLTDLENKLGNLDQYQGTLAEELNGLDSELGDLDSILGSPLDNSLTEAEFFESIVTHQAWIDKFVANEGYMRKATIRNAYVEEIVGDQGFFDQLVAADLWANTGTFSQAFADTITADTIWSNEVITNTIMSKNADIKGKLSVGTDQRVFIDPSRDTPPAGSILDSGTESLTGISPSDQGNTEFVPVTASLVNFENFNVTITLSATDGRDSGPTYAGTVTVQGYNSSLGAWEDLSSADFTMSRSSSTESFDDVVRNTVDSIGTYSDFRFKVYHNHVYADDGIHGSDFSGSYSFEWEVYEQTFLLNNKGSYIRTSDNTYEKLGTTTSVVTSGGGGGGITRWGDVADKPFETLGTGLGVSGGDLNVSLDPFDTGNLSEGSNKYFTESRVKSVVSGAKTFQEVGINADVSFNKIFMDATIRMDAGEAIYTNVADGYTNYIRPQRSGIQNLTGGSSAPWNGALTLEADQQIAFIESDNDEVMGWADVEGGEFRWRGQGYFNSLRLTGESDVSNWGTGLVVSNGDLTVSLSPFDTDNLSEGSNNLYYTDQRVKDAVSGANAFQEVGVDANVQFHDLELTGTVNYVNEENLQVEDKTITVNKNGTDTSAEGAGLIVERPSGNQSMLWDATNGFDFSDDITAPSAHVNDIIVNGQNLFESGGEQSLGIVDDVEFSEITSTGNLHMKGDWLRGYGGQVRGLIQTPQERETGTSTGNQDDFLAYADKRFTISSTPSPSGGSLGNMFRHGTSSCTWTFANSTDSLQIEIDFATTIHYWQALGFLFLYGRGADYIHMEYYDNNSSSWKDIIEITDNPNDNPTNHSRIIAPEFGASYVEKIRVTLSDFNHYNSSNDEYTVRINRFWGFTLGGQGHFFLPRSGGDVYGGLNLEGNFDVDGVATLNDDVILGNQATSSNHALRADRTLQFNSDADDVITWNVETARNLTTDLSWTPTIADHGSGQRGVLNTSAQNIYGAKTFQNLLTVGDDLFPDSNYSSNIGSPTSKFLTAHIAELRAEIMTVEERRATTGGRFNVGIATTLASDLGSADSTITVSHNNISNGDILHLEKAGQVEFIEVISTVTDNGDGTYSYDIARNLDGTGADSWDAGDGVFNTQQQGNGFIDMYATTSMKTSQTTAGPTLAFMERTGGSYDSISPRGVLGNLHGWYGYSTDIYGAGFGDESAENITVDPTNGIRIRNNLDVAMQLSGTLFKIGDSVNYVEYDVSNSSWDAQMDSFHWDAQNLSIDSTYGIEVANVHEILNDGTFDFSGGLLTGTTTSLTISGAGATIDVSDFDLSANGLAITTATGIDVGTDYWHNDTSFQFGGASGISYSGSGNVLLGTDTTVKGDLDAVTFTGGKATLNTYLQAGNVEVGSGIVNALDSGNRNADGLYVSDGTYIYGDERFSFAGGILKGNSSSITGAGWKWNNTRLRKSFTQGQFLISTDNSTANSAWASNTASGLPFLGLYYSHDGTGFNRSMIAIGETLDEGWTGRYGMSFTPRKDYPAWFEISRDMSSDAITATFAGSHFNEGAMWSANNGENYGGSGMYVSWADEQVSFAGGVLKAESSQVELAGFTSTSTEIYANGKINDDLVLSKSNDAGLLDSANYAEQGDGFGVPTIALTYSHDGSAGQRTYLTIGETYADLGWTGRYGFGFVDKKWGNPIFEVSRSLSSGSLYARLAGSRFDGDAQWSNGNSKTWRGSGLYVNWETEEFSMTDKFYVNSNGKMFASDADIQGKINASELYQDNQAVALKNELSDYWAKDELNNPMSGNDQFDHKSKTVTGTVAEDSTVTATVALDDDMSSYLVTATLTGGSGNEAVSTAIVSVMRDYITCDVDVLSDVEYFRGSINIRTYNNNSAGGNDSNSNGKKFQVVFSTSTDSKTATYHIHCIKLSTWKSSTPDTTPPPAPSITVSGNCSSRTVDWSDVGGGVDHYNVWRKVGSNSYEKVASTSSTSWTGGQDICAYSTGYCIMEYYYVEAVDGAGNKSTSNEESIQVCGDNDDGQIEA